MKKVTYSFFVIGLFVSLILFTAGCTEKSTAKTQDENIQTIEAVVQKALTGPSDELKKALEGDGFEDLVKYEEALYHGYFADDRSYLEFVNSYGSTLMIPVMRNDYKFTVKNIEYEKKDSEEIIYNFTVELQYQKEGSESSEVEMVTGQANLNENHKIERMVIRIGDFLRTLYDR